MTNVLRIQLRGNCQCCGRTQAVTNGYVAKHGYTVEDGYFQGVCQGNRYAPMQTERKVTDSMIQSVLEDAARLDILAADLKAGRKFPETAEQGREIVNGRGQAKLVPFAEASEYARENAVKLAIYRTESRARAARSWAATMQRLVDSLHGTALLEVPVEAGPAPIVSGEKRKGANDTVLTCLRLEKGRVYYRYDRKFNDGTVKPFTTWIGTQSWRKLPVAE